MATGRCRSRIWGKRWRRRLLNASFSLTQLEVPMANELRTEVHFQSSAFNTSESKDYFINPGCFGDDLCKWLMQELRAKGFRADGEPGQEDFGWYFTFHVGGKEHCLVVGYQPGDNDAGGIWRAWLERQRGFVLSILGARKSGILPEAANAIHGILSGSTQIQNVSWHFANAPEGDPGAKNPNA